MAIELPRSVSSEFAHCEDMKMRVEFAKAEDEWGIKTEEGKQAAQDRAKCRPPLEQLKEDQGRWTNNSGELPVVLGRSK